MHDQMKMNYPKSQQVKDGQHFGGHSDGTVATRRSIKKISGTVPLGWIIEESKRQGCDSGCVVMSGRKDQWCTAQQFQLSLCAGSPSNSAVVAAVWTLRTAMSKLNMHPAFRYSFFKTGPDAEEDSHSVAVEV